MVIRKLSSHLVSRWASIPHRLFAYVCMANSGNHRVQETWLRLSTGIGIRLLRLGGQPFEVESSRKLQLLRNRSWIRGKEFYITNQSLSDKWAENTRPVWIRLQTFYIIPVIAERSGDTPLPELGIITIFCDCVEVFLCLCLLAIMLWQCSCRLPRVPSRMFVKRNDLSIQLVQRNFVEWTMLHQRARNVGG